MNILEKINAEHLVGDRYRLMDAPMQAWGEFRAFTPPGADPAKCLNIEPASLSWNTEARKLAGYAAIREAVKRGAALGFDSYMCDNNPKHGAGIYARA